MNAQEKLAKRNKRYKTSAKVEMKRQALAEKASTKEEGQSARAEQKRLAVHNYGGGRSSSKLNPFTATGKQSRIA